MKINIKLIVLFLIIVSNCSYGQDTVKVTREFGSKNPEIQNLYDFENISIEKFNFESDKLKGKSYTIKMIEFKDGKKIDSTFIFDEKGSDYFKIKSTKMSLKFNVKLDKEKLKVGIVGNGFRTQAIDFKLDANKKYALKDFFGKNTEINLDITKTNSMSAIITPSMNKDCSGSYCNVVQSGIEPNKLGEHFKIPHYYLIQIDFK